MNHSIPRPFVPAYVGGRSPWGTIDHVEPLAEGICRVSTPRHGGLKLDRDRNAKMPQLFRQSGGWYEEDCEYAFVYVVFPNELKLDKKTWEDAKHTVGWWFPDKYETYFGEILKPGESWVKDKRLHFESHAEDWLVTCAWGDWHEKVPKGKVGVRAVQGKYHDPEFGLRPSSSGAVSRYFLVDVDRYDGRSGLPYVVGPEDKECPPIQ